MKCDGLEIPGINNLNLLTNHRLVRNLLQHLICQAGTHSQQLQSVVCTGRTEDCGIFSLKWWKKSHFTEREKPNSKHYYKRKIRLIRAQRQHRYSYSFAALHFQIFVRVLHVLCTVICFKHRHSRGSLSLVRLRHSHLFFVDAEESAPFINGGFRQQRRRTRAPTEHLHVRHRMFLHTVTLTGIYLVTRLVLVLGCKSR